MQGEPERHHRIQLTSGGGGGGAPVMLRRAGMELWVWDPAVPASAGGGGGDGAFHVFMAPPSTPGPQPSLQDWLGRVRRAESLPRGMDRASSLTRAQRRGGAQSCSLPLPPGCSPATHLDSHTGSAPETAPFGQRRGRAGPSELKATAPARRWSGPPRRPPPPTLPPPPPPPLSASGQPPRRRQPDRRWRWRRRPGGEA